MVTHLCSGIAPRLINILTWEVRNHKIQTFFNERKGRYNVIFPLVFKIFVISIFKKKHVHNTHLLDLSLYYKTTCRGQVDYHFIAGSIGNLQRSSDVMQL